jgi:eukaryotic-like serine/threonine-protein kinase
VLERQVRSRVDSLSPGAQDLARAAAVLGQEMNLGLLIRVCPGGDGAEGHLGELCQAGLLQSVPGAPEPAYRFRHALLQEAVYRGMLRSERRRIHGRAAWAIEETSPGRLPEVAAVLGRHFAAANETDKAVHYFELAGGQAASAYANEEAMASYRSALGLLGAGEPAAPRSAVASRLWAKVAELAWLTGGFDEARLSYRQAIAVAHDIDSLACAQLHVALGGVESAARSYAAARAEFEAAQELLGDDIARRDEPTTDVWIELMLGRAVLYESMSQHAEQLAILEQARPVVEERGDPWRKAWLYVRAARARAALDRYRISQDVLADMEVGAKIAEELVRLDDPAATGWCFLYMGYFCVLAGELSRAREYLERALAVAEPRGYAQLKAASLVAQVIGAIRAHDVERVGQLAPAAVEVSGTIGYLDWVAMAKGALAWLAWREGRRDEVLALAAECDELMQRPHGPEVFVNWVRLWPVVAVHLAAGEIEPAVDASRQMLEPSQQRFEDELETLLVAACAAWDNGRPERAGLSLTDALALAEALRYC